VVVVCVCVRVARFECVRPTAAVPIGRRKSSEKCAREAKHYGGTNEASSRRKSFAPAACALAEPPVMRPPRSRAVRGISTHRFESRSIERPRDDHQASNSGPRSRFDRFGRFGVAFCLPLPSGPPAAAGAVLVMPQSVHKSITIQPGGGGGSARFFTESARRARGHIDRIRSTALLDRACRSPFSIDCLDGGDRKRGSPLRSGTVSKRVRACERAWLLLLLPLLSPQPGGKKRRAE
jgi:hypothetical protein